MANNLPKSKLIHEVIAEQDAIILGKTVLKESGKSLVADTEIAKIHAPNSDNETASSIATIIDGTTAKTPLVDTDTFPLTEPTTLKKTLWSTIKSTLKTYFDGLYLALTGGTLTGNVGIGKTSPENPLTFSAAKAVGKTQGIKLYNTTDETTNTGSGHIYMRTLDAVPILSFDTTGTGTIGAGYHSFRLNNTPVLEVDAAQAIFYGKFFFSPDKTRDIGRKSTSPYRPNNVYVGGYVQISAPVDTGIDSSLQVYGVGTTTHPICHFLDGSGNTKLKLFSNGKLGLGSSLPDKQLEINSADGNNLRLTYNDSDGSAANYVDFLVSSSGDLTITPSGGDIEIGSANIHTTGALKGVHKANDGTNAVADGTYTVGIGTTTNGTITIKDGIITAVQQAT